MVSKGETSRTMNGRITSLKNGTSLFAIFLLFGCASSRVEEYRSAETGISSEESIVLLGRATYDDKETDSSFTDCMVDSLVKGARKLKVIPQDEFKDDFFPWFEPRVEPASAQDLKELFALTRFRERIEERNVKYIAWIEGDTVRLDDGGTMSCTIGPWGGGCLGFS